MSDPDKIATEMIQKLSSSQAWEYRIVPYMEEDGCLHCYGETDADHQGRLAEIAILTGKPIRITGLEPQELNKLLKHYYRRQTNADHLSESNGGRGFLMNLINEAFFSYASDIHLEAYEDRHRIRFRIDGKLIERYVIKKQHYASLVNQIKILSNLDISEKRLPQDGRIFYSDERNKFDVRVCVLPAIYGEKVVMRLLTRHIELLELTNLGFDDHQLNDYLEAVKKPNGLILISGPTGSGKSTTLYATLRHLNEESRNILTIEDPVEYTLEGVNQVQLKEEIGLTFSSALRTFLRQDPDIIMLGEIRDIETAQMALRSSLTGHLIFSTIHTNSAWGSVARLTDMGIHPYLLSNTLLMCIAQRLIRLLCPACKTKHEVSDGIRQYFPAGQAVDHCYEPVGCEQCYYTGYKGRKAIYEVIRTDHVLTEAIRNQQGDITQHLNAKGVVTLKDAAIALFKNGLTSFEEIIPLLK